MTNLIELRKIRKTINESNGQSRVLFDDLDFNLSQHERSVALLGRSGSGKSSLLRILAGLDVRYTGEYRSLGRTLPQRADSMASYRLENVGIVTQAYDLINDLNVVQNVKLATPKAAGADLIAQQALIAVGLSDFAHKRISKLSGGEAQRVAIARAIAKKPAIVLADEPTGALDEGTEDEVLRLFKDLESAGTRFVIATHSNKVAESCDRRLILEKNRLVEVR